MKKALLTVFTKLYGFYFNSFVHFSARKTSEKAFLLFCTPRKGKILPHQKDFLESAKDQLIATNNIAIQTYRWHGVGSTVLLLHGWESNTFRWREFISLLQEEGYDIVSMDAPAHGNSTGDTLNVPLYADCAQTVIETYNPRFVIGHSIGGMTMVYNQYKYPNPVIEKLVSLAAPSELSDFMRQYKVMLGLSKKLMKHLEIYFVEKFGFKFSEFSNSKFIKNSTKEGLLIHDEFDLITPFWCSEQVHSNWKNSTLIKTQNLGHSLHQNKVRNDVVTFLNS